MLVQSQGFDPYACLRHAAAPQWGMHSAAHLPAVPSTLLIPLAARAHGDRYFPWLACHDTVARGLLERLGVDADAWLDDQFTVLNVLWRTRAIREAGRAFFADHPRGTGASLGCGLSHHFQWLDTGANHWLDADLPEVMALRAPLLPPGCPRARHAVTDIARPGWWRRLRLPTVHGGAGTQPVFVVCEGVLMYLEPPQVQAVLREFAHAPGRGPRGKPPQRGAHGRTVPMGGAEHVGTGARPPAPFAAARTERIGVLWLARAGTGDAVAALAGSAAVRPGHAGRGLGPPALAHQAPTAMFSEATSAGWGPCP